MKKLDLSKVGMLDPDREVELKSAFDLIEEVEQYVEERMGIAAYEQPPTVPPDLGEGLADKADALTLDELGVLHAQYVAYAAFLDSRLARIKAAYKVAETNLKHISADLATKLYAKGGIPKKEVPDHIKLDGLYREFEVEYLRLYMMRVLLEARHGAYDAQAKAISRLITLKLDEREASRRDHNVGRGRGKHPAKDGRGRFG